MKTVGQSKEVLEFHSNLPLLTLIDEELDISNYEDEMYSDYWDDDVYDPMDPYDWY